jgi:hypothetical protein
MELLKNSLSWQSIAFAAVIYFLSMAFYRLFLHPLAGFPGPMIAAITRYYEAYYDVIQNGQYTFQIAKMHEKYGKIPQQILAVTVNRTANFAIRKKVPLFVLALTSFTSTIQLSTNSCTATKVVGTDTPGPLMLTVSMALSSSRLTTTGIKRAGYR